jgi:ASPIC and UnbV.
VVALRGTASNRFGVGATVKIWTRAGCRCGRWRWRAGVFRRASRCCISGLAKKNATVAFGFGYVSAEEVIDEAAQQPLLPFRLNRRGPALAIGDLDGDLDLFVGARVVPGFYPEKVRRRLLVNRGWEFDDVTDTVAKELADVGLVTALAAAGYYSQSSTKLHLGRTEENPLRKVRVRWPSGGVSEHDVPAGSAMLTLSSP